jgi:prophage tail gpP-like protein
MGADFIPSHAESEQVALTLIERPLILKNWKSYEFSSHFLTPTDGWSFTIGAEDLDDETKQALRVGVRVSLTINGAVQAHGYIDAISISASRSGGLEYTIQGRDTLAQAVDSCADPTQSLKEGMNLEQALVSLFAPFGWGSPDRFTVTNDASRGVKTGTARGVKYTKGGRRKPPRPTMEYLLHQLRPHSREGVFEFASRIAQRFGLWIWSTASGEQLVVSKPAFDVDPYYVLRRNRKGTTNVLDGTVHYNIADQPTLIVADGVSGGGEFGRGRIKTIMGNTAVFCTDPAYLKPFEKYPDAKRLLGHNFPTLMRVPRARTLYLHDDESQTQENLDAYVRREMALLQRRSITADYTVEGHGQNTPDGFVPWTVDTTVDVEDEVAGFFERMYVMGRTFRKSRDGGTSTHLELIRLYTLEFGEPHDQAPAGAKGGPKLQEDIASGTELPPVTLF